MLIRIKGILDFKIEDITKKHRNQSSWKRVAIIKTNCDMDRYYAWFLKKRFNIELNKNIRGSHVTIISDKLDKDIFSEASRIFHNKEIEFFIELEPLSNGKHWWLRVYCPMAESIREAIGLDKEPYFGFHFTIGYVNEKNIKHSEYILNVCKRHNLIINNGKKSIDDFKII